MKLVTVIKYVGAWMLGVLALAKLWFPFVQSVSKNEVYVLHACIWPIILWTVCYSAVWGVSLDKNEGRN